MQNTDLIKEATEYTLDNYKDTFRDLARSDKLIIEAPSDPAMETTCLGCE